MAERPPPRRRRGKYVAEACFECKRRKIKCSGDNPCRGCTSNGLRECKYAAQEPRTQDMPPSISNRMLLSSFSPNDWPVWHLDELADVQYQTPDLPIAPAGLERPTVEQANGTTNSTTVQLNGPYPSSRSLEASMQETQNGEAAPDEPYVTSLLFPDQELSSLLSRWFDETDFFYPFLSRTDFYSRLSRFFIADATCINDTTCIPKTSPHLELAPLTCGMVAVAKLLGGGAEAASGQDDDEHYVQSSMVWYAECLRLRECITATEQQAKFDVLRLYLVEVLYASMRNKAREMSRAMVLAVEQAYALGLNDDSGWSSDDVEDNEYHRLMWWTLYHLDRRVALKVGQPILIYDQSFSVGEFSSLSRDLYLKQSYLETSQPRPGLLGLNWKYPAPLSPEWYDYVQFARAWDQVVGNAWDSVFSPRARRSPNASALNGADSALAQLLVSCPDTLTWDRERMPAHIPSGNAERSCRLRFITFESIVSLRLLLRTNFSPLQRDLRSPAESQSLESAEELACEIIDAVTLYLSVREKTRPGAVYSSLVVLQAVNWIAPLIRKKGDLLSTSTQRLISSVKAAKICLERQESRLSQRIAFDIGNILDRANDVSLAD